MNSLAQILAATDLSAHGRHAADRAALIADGTGARLTLLHAPAVRALAQVREWLGEDHESRIRDDAVNRLQALADELGAARGVDIDTRLAEDTVLDAVPQAADDMDAGLIVVGARGAGFLRRLVLGSTAERLLRRTTRPLLIVRGLAHAPYRRALLSVDFSPWSPAVLAMARQVAPQARCVLFHAFQVPFEEKLRFAGVADDVIDKYRTQARADAMRQLGALARDAGFKPSEWDACIVEGDPSMRLVEQEQAQDGDLVVIGKHGHSMVEDLLLGSVTKHVLAEGVADVLVATRRDGAP